MKRIHSFMLAVLCCVFTHVPAQAKDLGTTLKSLVSRSTSKGSELFTNPTHYHAAIGAAYQSYQSIMTACHENNTLSNHPMVTAFFKVYKDLDLQKLYEHEAHYKQKDIIAFEDSLLAHLLKSNAQTLPQEIAQHMMTINTIMRRLLSPELYPKANVIKRVFAAVGHDPSTLIIWGALASVTFVGGSSFISWLAKDKKSQKYALQTIDLGSATSEQLSTLSMEVTAAANTLNWQFPDECTTSSDYIAAFLNTYKKSTPEFQQRVQAAFNTAAIECDAARTAAELIGKHIQGVQEAYDDLKEIVTQCARRYATLVKPSSDVEKEYEALMIESTRQLISLASELGILDLEDNTFRTQEEKDAVIEERNFCRILAGCILTTNSDKPLCEWKEFAAFVNEEKTYNDIARTHEKFRKRIDTKLYQFGTISFDSVMEAFAAYIDMGNSQDELAKLQEKLQSEALEQHVKLSRKRSSWRKKGMRVRTSSSDSGSNSDSDTVTSGASTDLSSLFSGAGGGAGASPAHSDISSDSETPTPRRRSIAQAAKSWFIRRSSKKTNVTLSTDNPLLTALLPPIKERRGSIQSVASNTTSPEKSETTE